MGCKTETKQIKLEAASVTWGKQACREITTVSDSSDSLDGQLITLEGFSPAGEKVVYLIGKGADTGEGEIDVVFDTDASAIEVAEAFATAIDALPEFRAESDGDEIYIFNRFRGKVENESIGSTGFDYDLKIEGILVDMGATEGAIELSIDTNLFDVTTDQTGELVIDQIYQGASATVTADFIEVTKERFDTLVGEVTGASITPMGGQKVTGFGQSRLFQSMRELGGQMVLHPIRLPQEDRELDVIFWNSAPLIDGLTFSGTAPQALSVEFNAYLDESKDKKINLFAKGDWTQDGLDA